VARTSLLAPETLKLVYGAFNECLKEGEASVPSDQRARAKFRIRLVQAILRAAAAGEREPEVLKVIGLKSIGQLPKDGA
jgi:hypothetical protein